MINRAEYDIIGLPFNTTILRGKIITKSLDMTIYKSTNLVLSTYAFCITYVKAIIMFINRNPRDMI